MQPETLLSDIQELMSGDRTAVMHAVVSRNSNLSSAADIENQDGLGISDEAD